MLRQSYMYTVGYRWWASSAVNLHVQSFAHRDSLISYSSWFAGWPGRTWHLRDISECPSLRRNCKFIQWICLVLEVLQTVTGRVKYMYSKCTCDRAYTFLFWALSLSLLWCDIVLPLRVSLHLLSLWIFLSLEMSSSSVPCFHRKITHSWWIIWSRKLHVHVLGIEQL